MDNPKNIMQWLGVKVKLEQKQGQLTALARHDGDSHAAPQAAKIGQRWLDAAVEAETTRGIGAAVRSGSRQSEAEAGCSSGSAHRRGRFRRDWFDEAVAADSRSDCDGSTREGAGR
ncbi:hypothetical protein TRIUR3_24962 [Triticum urartu]|uniref:Uncharacterized protein n=1 Tax=Triticum urartu TaxID=4572 RepID=M7Y972_TRIUA|nr:hypothetical protein TRIUR3_24962 [Triticum urartu]